MLSFDVLEGEIAWLYYWGNVPIKNLASIFVYTFHFHLIFLVIHFYIFKNVPLQIRKKSGFLP